MLCQEFEPKYKLMIYWLYGLNIIKHMVVYQSVSCGHVCANVSAYRTCAITHLHVYDRTFAHFNGQKKYVCGGKANQGSVLYHNWTTDINTT